MEKKMSPFSIYIKQFEAFASFLEGQTAQDCAQLAAKSNNRDTFFNYFHALLESNWVSEKGLNELTHAAFKEMQGQRKKFKKTHAEEIDLCTVLFQSRLEAEQQKSSGSGSSPGTYSQKLMSHLHDALTGPFPDVLINIVHQYSLDTAQNMLQRAKGKKANLTNEEFETLKSFPHESLELHDLELETDDIRFVTEHSGAKLSLINCKLAPQYVEILYTFPQIITLDLRGTSGIMDSCFSLYCSALSNLQELIITEGCISQRQEQEIRRAKPQLVITKIA